MDSRPTAADRCFTPIRWDSRKSGNVCWSSGGNRRRCWSGWRPKAKRFPDRLFFVVLDEPLHPLVGWKDEQGDQDHDDKEHEQQNGKSHVCLHLILSV